MVDPAFEPPPAILGAPAPRRLRAIVAAVGACVVAGAMAFGVALVVRRAPRGPVLRDRVFEAMVAAPITAIEAEPSPPIVVVAPLAPRKPRSLRSRVASPTPPAPRSLASARPPVAALPAEKSPPRAPPPDTVAALPREPMPPPFAVFY